MSAIANKISNLEITATTAPLVTFRDDTNADWSHVVFHDAADAAIINARSDDDDDPSAPPVQCVRCCVDITDTCGFVVQPSQCDDEKFSDKELFPLMHFACFTAFPPAAFLSVLAADMRKNVVTVACTCPKPNCTNTKKQYSLARHFVLNTACKGAASLPQQEQSKFVIKLAKVLGK
jgi:hypothetical protein